MYPQRSVMTCGLATALEPPHFNHAPVRGAIGASFSRRSRAGSFNPRTRVGCDQSLVLYHRAAREFQSTHPRGVRPSTINALSHVFKVSIHAPAWGATYASCSKWSETHRFQSTHPRGVRPHAAGKQGKHHLVSIHAPAWGATSESSAFTIIASQFQSTHPRGVRPFVI